MSDLSQPNTLPATEQQQLSQHELVIERGLKSFVDVGNSLRDIRDLRLYRATHATFDVYCRERWGATKSHVNFTIRAAGVHGTLSDNNCCHLPSNEAQIRDLGKVADGDRTTVWDDVLCRAPKRITFKILDRFRRDSFDGKRPLDVTGKTA